MAKAKKTTTVIVSAVIKLDTSIEISAESLEEALQKAKALKIDDFVQIYGDHNDSDLKITGLFEARSIND